MPGVFIVIELMYPASSPTISTVSPLPKPPVVDILVPWLTSHPPLLDAVSPILTGMPPTSIFKFWLDIITPVSDKVKLPFVSNLQRFVSELVPTTISPAFFSTLT